MVRCVEDGGREREETGRRDWLAGAGLGLARGLLLPVVLYSQAGWRKLGSWAVIGRMGAGAQAGWLELASGGRGGVPGGAFLAQAYGTGNRAWEESRSSLITVPAGPCRWALGTGQGGAAASTSSISTSTSCLLASVHFWETMSLAGCR